MKLCTNCHTLNSPDAILCSECGMSLIKAPTGEAALKLRKVWEADHPEELRPSGKAGRPTETAGGHRPKSPIAIAFVIGSVLVSCLLELTFESDDPSVRQTGEILLGIVLAGLAAFYAWVAAIALGGRLADRWAGRGRPNDR
jgi:hypothetical protein